MTNHTDLIARLREGQKYDCESGYPIVMDYIMDEAADALQAAQAEIERLQTTVKHLSDAAANATFAEKAALAQLAELSKQEPVGFVESAVRGAGGFHACFNQGVFVPAGSQLYAAPAVQPSQADAQDAARYRWLREYLPSDDLQYDDDLVLAKTGAEIDSAIDAAINTKESGK